MAFQIFNVVSTGVLIVGLSQRAGPHRFPPLTWCVNDSKISDQRRKTTHNDVSSSGQSFLVFFAVCVRLTIIPMWFHPLQLQTFHFGLRAVNRKNLVLSRLLTVMATDDLDVRSELSIDEILQIFRHFPRARLCSSETF
jgi:hypothetical protein